MIRTIRTVCAHDCPDQCSLLAHVEDGRIVRIEGDPDAPVHGRLRLHQGSSRPRAGSLAGAPAHAAAPRGRQGRRAVRPGDLGQRARRDREPLAGHHARGRSGGDPRLRVQRPPGTVQPRPDARAVSRPRHEPAPGRHRVRHLRGGRVGCGVRQRGRRRSGDGRALRSHHRLGGGPPHDERAHLALRGAGAQGGGHRGRHRATPEPHRRPGRLAPARERRHGRRAGAGGDARARPRRTLRPRLPRAAHPRIRAAGARGAAALPSRAGGGDHRGERRRPRALGPPVRPRAGALHPAGRGHVALAAGRPGHPRRGAAAWRGRRLRQAGRGRAPHDRGQLRDRRYGAPQAVRTGARPHGQSLATRGGAAHLG